jgi:hypothetical protein
MRDYDRTMTNTLTLFLEQGLLVNQVFDGMMATISGPGVTKPGMVKSMTT